MESKSAGYWRVTAVAFGGVVLAFVAAAASITATGHGAFWTGSAMIVAYVSAVLSLAAWTAHVREWRYPLLRRPRPVPPEIMRQLQTGFWEKEPPPGPSLRRPPRR